jgi:hypothetical protein
MGHLKTILSGMLRTAEEGPADGDGVSRASKHTHLEANSNHGRGKTGENHEKGLDY